MNSLVEDTQKVLNEKLPKGLIVPEHTASAHFYRYTPEQELYPSVTTVTGILDKPYLPQWAARVALEQQDANAHNNLREEAAEIGIQGHKVVENYVNMWIANKARPHNITDFIPEGSDARLWPIAKSAELFFTELEAIPIASELLVASPTIKTAGTLDLLLAIPRVKRTGNGNEHCKKMGHYWCLYPNPKRKYDEWCPTCNESRTWHLVLGDLKTSNSIANKPDYQMQTATYRYLFFELTGLKCDDILIIRLDKEKTKYELISVDSPLVPFRAFKHLREVYTWHGNFLQYQTTLGTVPTITL